MKQKPCTWHLGTYETGPSLQRCLRLVARAVERVLIPGNLVPKSHRQHTEQGQVEQGPSGSVTVHASFFLPASPCC